MDKRTRSIAEKKIYVVLFDIEMNGAGGNAIMNGSGMHTSFDHSQLQLQLNNGSYMTYLQS